MSDFTVLQNGAVWTIIAETDKAKAFANDRFAPPNQSGSPEFFSIYWHPAEAMIDKLIEDGFTVDKTVRH